MRQIRSFFAFPFLMIATGLIHLTQIFTLIGHKLDGQCQAFIGENVETGEMVCGYKLSGFTMVHFKISMPEKFRIAMRTKL